ncbi:hypothetical protein ACFL27_06220 [candidate division CSSED10-310 bacterium]|uniref:Uridine kinase n=1 Tax=candidate division CSSED10-310 bacterium TaxID=2855610 RepID=A0ABV6YUA6_UNCC1
MKVPHATLIMDMVLMLRTHLILIDGIAGTGKTTLSHNLHRIVNTVSGNAILSQEFDTPHLIHEWDVDDYPRWKNKTIENWNMLALNLLRTHSIGIVESSLFQGTVGDLLERDIDEKTIFEYAFQVPSLLQITSPVLIYLVPDDITTHIEHTYAQRKGGWQTKIDQFIQQTAYGRARNLSGLEGYIIFLKTLKRLSDQLFQTYEMKKLLLNISQYFWDDYEALITNFLEISSQNFLPDPL